MQSWEQDKGSQQLVLTFTEEEAAKLASDLFARAAKQFRDNIEQHKKETA